MEETSFYPRNNGEHRRFGAPTILPTLRPPLTFTPTPTVLLLARDEQMDYGDSDAVKAVTRAALLGGDGRCEVDVLRELLAAQAPKAEEQRLKAESEFIAAHGPEATKKVSRSAADGRACIRLCLGRSQQLLPSLASPAAASRHTHTQDHLSGLRCWRNGGSAEGANPRGGRHPGGHAAPRLRRFLPRGRPPPDRLRYPQLLHPAYHPSPARVSTPWSVPTVARQPASEAAPARAGAGPGGLKSRAAVLGCLTDGTRFGKTLTCLNRQ